MTVIFKELLKEKLRYASSVCAQAVKMESHYECHLSWMQEDNTGKIRVIKNVKEACLSENLVLSLKLR